MIPLPVSLDNSPISNKKVEPAAVHVYDNSVLFFPCNKFILCIGIPLNVRNAGNILSPKSIA